MILTYIVKDSRREEIMDNIDFCSLVEKEALIGFIKSHWSESHILTKSNEILDFQHREINRYNFIISKNQQGAITGILGFIPLSKYDMLNFVNKQIKY